MKTDLGPGSGAGPEETLRAILREWRVPSPPPGMEEDLRRAFRRRRGRRRLGTWLAAAAALAGLAAWPLVRKDAGPSVATGSPAATLGTPVPSPRAVAAEPVPSEPTRPEHLEPTGTRRRPGRPLTTPAPDRVIIEPGQADLLVRFSERLQDIQPPTTVLSSAEVTVAPARAPEPPALAGATVRRYQAEWKAVAGVWPLVQLSAPTMGR